MSSVGDVNVTPYTRAAEHQTDFYVNAVLTQKVLLRSSFLQEEIDLRRPFENEKAQESKDEESQASVNNYYNIN